MGYDPTIAPALAALQAAMPTAPVSAPPGIGVTGAIGTTGVYAAANHTHASSVQRSILTTDANGQATWTFPNAYTVAPVVEGTAVNVTGATQPYVTNLVGDPTTTTAKFQVFKAAPVTVSILGATVNIFSAVAAGIKVHVWAALPTS